METMTTTTKSGKKSETNLENGLPRERYRIPLERMTQRDILIFISRDNFESKLLAG